MNSFQRVMAAVALSKGDRVPVVPQVTYTTSRLIGVKFSEPMTDPWLMAQALLKGYRVIGYDGIYVGWESSFNLMAEAMGCRLRMVEDDNPSVAQGVVHEPRDLGKVKLPNPEVDGRLPVYLEAIDHVKADVKGEAALFSYVPGPLTLSGLLYSVEKLMLDIIENPCFIHELNRVSAEASKAFAVAKAERGVDVVVIADPMASAGLLSPHMFQEFSLPYLKVVTSAIIKNGAIPSLHICGKTEPILEKMLNSGARILEVDRLVSLSEAKKRVGERVCLMGNVGTDTLLTGSPADVELEAKRCIEDAGSGGFILSSGCEVPLNAPVENIGSMVEAARKYGVYYR